MNKFRSFRTLLSMFLVFALLVGCAPADLPPSQTVDTSAITVESNPGIITLLGTITGGTENSAKYAIFRIIDGSNSCYVAINITLRDSTPVISCP